MKKAFSFLFILAVSLGSLPIASAQRQGAAPKRFEPSEKSWKFADKMLKKMSVDEKIGQLVHIGINARYTNQDSDYFKGLVKEVRDNKVGGIIVFGAPIYETVHLVNRMQENAKVPLLISVDAETGVGMRFADAANFPWAMAVAATGNPDYARRMGVVTGRESRALGIHHVFAPTVDVNNNADNPVINVRSFGEDPEAVGTFGAAFIEGVQSSRALATAKHFPGHGDTNIDSHRGLPLINVSRERLNKVELPPFRRAIEAGVASVMVGHIGLPQIDPEEIKPLKNALRVDAEEGAEIVDEKTTIPATLSKVVQTDILRKEMGFKGLIVSDAMSMSGLTLYMGQAEAGVRAVLAGTDILEKPADTDEMLRGLREALKSGRISGERLDESVRRQLAWKHELGLFKERLTPIEAIDTVVSTRDVYKLSEEIAEKSVTLVRNDAGLIPVDRTKRVAFIGLSNGFDNEATAAAFNRTMRENGIKATSVVIQENSTAETLKRARETAQNADIVIAGLFGRVRSGAKNSVGLPEEGVKILRGLLASGKPVVGIGFGNPYILGSFPELTTYMVAYGDMPSLQRSSARAVFGLQDIGGRLPIALPGLYPIGTGIRIEAKK